MLQINFDDNSMLGLFLFGLIMMTVSGFQRQSNSSSRSSAYAYPAYHLACLLEDAPAKALKGQAYELATPLMTPFACVVPELWHIFYQQNLGKSGIDYWQWINQPEVKNICPELTLLLTLPPPQEDVKDVLESLATDNNPLLPTKNKEIYSKFNPQDLQTQTRRYFAFKQWHNQAQQQIGDYALKAVYQVCYRTEWTVIQQILDDKILAITKILIDESAPWWKVLGVHPKSNTSQVEKAYKTLLRNWHPDLNKHPHANEITARLNVAYEQYQVFLEASQQPQFNYNLWVKVKDWFSVNQD
jgi:hypothetical protein